MKLEIDAHRSTVVVHGRATGHRFHSKFSGLGGGLEIPLESPNEATGSISLPMSKVDAGDFLRTAQIKRFLEPAKFPNATFALHALSLGSAEEFAAALNGEREVGVEVTGTLSYRSRQVDLKAQARGTLSNDGRLRAICKFKLDLRTLHIEPPSFLFLKVNPEVDIEVEIFGAQGPLFP